MNAKRVNRRTDVEQSGNTIPVGFMPLEMVRTSLSRTWFAGCGLVFLVLLVQSFGSVYRDQLTEVWSWAMPAMLPALSLIVSVLGADAITSREVDAKKIPPQFFVRKSFYSLVLWLSVINIVLLIGTICAQPLFIYFHSAENLSPDDIIKGANTGKVVANLMRPADVLKISNLWLAPFQSIVIAAMGVLFFTKRVG